MSELVLCSNCGEPAKYRLKKLCARCYQRFRAHGDFDTHAKIRQKCIVVGCDDWVKAHDLCTKHYRRLLKHGTFEDGKWTRRGSDRCAVPHCGQPHRSMGLCTKHYQAEQRRGHPLWRTQGRRKVHGDRPWTPETVQDFARLFAWEDDRHALTQATGLEQPPDEEPRSVMNTTIDCPFCGRNAEPIECGERTRNGPCRDLLCPSCGEELLLVDASATGV